MISWREGILFLKCPDAPRGLHRVRNSHLFPISERRVSFHSCHWTSIVRGGSDGRGDFRRQERGEVIPYRRLRLFLIDIPTAFRINFALDETRIRPWPVGIHTINTKGGEETGPLFVDFSHGTRKHVRSATFPLSQESSLTGLRSAKCHLPVSYLPCLNQLGGGIGGLSGQPIPEGGGEPNRVVPVDDGVSFHPETIGAHGFQRYSNIFAKLGEGGRVRHLPVTFPGIDIHLAEQLPVVRLRAVGLRCTTFSTFWWPPQR